MPTHEIPADTAKEILSRGESANFHVTEVAGAEVSFARGVKDMAENGPRVEPGDRVRITGAQGPFWAYSHGSDASVTIDSSSWGIDYMSRPDFGTIDSVDSVGEIQQPVDITDRQGRQIGKARLMDSGGALIDGANPFPVTDAVHGNESNVYTDTLGADGTFAAQAVPDGSAVVYRADPGNVADVTVDGSFPLPPGEHVSLGVDDVSVPAFAFGDAGDSMHAIVEVA